MIYDFAMFFFLFFTKAFQHRQVLCSNFRLINHSGVCYNTVCDENSEI